MKQDELVKRIKKLENKVRILEIEVADKIEANAYPDEVEVKKIDWEGVGLLVAFSVFYSLWVAYGSVFLLELGEPLLAGLWGGAFGFILVWFTHSCLKDTTLVSHYKVPARGDDDDC